MNKQLLIFAAIITWIFISASCKKKDDCVAGSGGAVTIAAFPQHHTKPIFSTGGNHTDTAYVKFGTQDFPGTNPASYDLVIAGDSGEDHVHIPNLKCGEYYIYMTGFDTSINQRVTGGIPYSFSQTSGEIDLDVPVTE
jgi:hypothetical protein